MKHRVSDGVMESKKEPAPRLLKVLVLLFISLLGLLAIRLFHSTFPEGWMPTVALLAALGLIAAALIEVIRTQ